jgi:hypothetical protein
MSVSEEPPHPPVLERMSVNHEMSAKRQGRIGSFPPEPETGPAEIYG